MPNRVLVAASQADLAGRLGRGLALEGYAVELVGDGRAVLAAALAAAPDVVVLDQALPLLDGLEVTRHIRAAGIDVPIIMVSAGERSDDRITSLDTGADDCVSTTAPLGELLARVRAQLRRHRRADGEILRFEPLLLDLAGHEVWVGSRQVGLTRHEFDLLELFLRYPGRVLRRDDIYDRVWGYDYGAESNVIEVHICSLRRKLAGAGAPNLIHTVRGFGYILKRC